MASELDDLEPPRTASEFTDSQSRPGEPPTLRRFNRADEDAGPLTTRRTSAPQRATHRLPSGPTSRRSASQDRQHARPSGRCASTVQLAGRFTALVVITSCDDGGEHRRVPWRRVRALPGEQDRGARARGLLFGAGWGDDAGPRPLALRRGDPGAAGDRGGQAGGGRGLHRADGGPSPRNGPMAATRGRRRRPGRRDRRDAERPEVRLDGVGAGGPLAARADRERARPGGRADNPPPTRAGPRRATPLQRPGRRRARQGRDRHRVPPHHRPRRLGRAGARPSAAQPRRHHRRGARGQPDRCRRVTADLSLSAGAWRFLPCRTRRRACAGGIRDRTGHRQGRPLLRDRRCSPRAVRGVLRALPRGSQGGGAFPCPLRPRTRARQPAQPRAATRARSPHRPRARRGAHRPPPGPAREW
jgi:hypothetical protein